MSDDKTRAPRERIHAHDKADDDVNEYRSLQDIVDTQTLERPVTPAGDDDDTVAMKRVPSAADARAAADTDVLDPVSDADDRASARTDVLGNLSGVKGTAKEARNNTIRPDLNQPLIVFQQPRSEPASGPNPATSTANPSAMNPATPDSGVKKTDTDASRKASPEPNPASNPAEATPFAPAPQSGTVPPATFPQLMPASGPQPIEAPEPIRPTGPSMPTIVFGLMGILLGGIGLLFGLQLPELSSFLFGMPAQQLTAMIVAAFGVLLIIIAIVWAIVGAVGRNGTKKAEQTNQA